MQDKEEVCVDGEELTVWYHEQDGTAGKCHYCSKIGRAQLVVVEEIDLGGVKMEESEPLYLKAVDLVRRARLH